MGFAVNLIADGVFGPMLAHYGITIGEKTTTKLRNTEIENFLC
jgi:hypothetical protein